jgi:hypothetical protein
VTALHIGFMDTDMTAEIDAVKTDPAIIAGLALDGVALDGVETGAIEVLTDQMTREAKAPTHHRKRMVLSCFHKAAQPCGCRIRQEDEKKPSAIKMRILQTSR